MNLAKLKVNHQHSPLGIDDIPVFSWILESDRKEIRQESFRIQNCRHNIGIF